VSLLSIAAASWLTASITLSPCGDAAEHNPRWQKSVTQSQLRFWIHDEPSIDPKSLRLHYVRPDGTKYETDFHHQTNACSIQDLYAPQRYEKPANFTWSITGGYRTLKGGSFQFVQKGYMNTDSLETRYIIQHGDSESAKALGLPADSGEPWPVI